MIVLFGFHAIEALLQKQPGRILHVYLKEQQSPRLQTLMNALEAHHIPYDFTSKETLDRMTHQGNHQGVAAQCTKTKVYSETDIPSILDDLTGPPLLLILEGIQDPHNLGACLRTADAAGVHAVLAPKDRSCGLTPAVIKVACGAAETVPFVAVTNLVRVMTKLKEQGIWLLGMADEVNKTLYQETLKMPLAFVLGNEEKGLRRLTREHCDVLLNIPMRGFVSSLNVSVAAAVCLYEAVRQRDI